MAPEPESPRGLPDPRRPLPAGWWGAVHERFLEQARLRPDRVALVEPGGDDATSGRPRTWTYAALAAASGRLAARLRRAGIGREDLVALHTGRSADLVRGMLGALEAGAGFLVLDPAHPGGHRARCLELARAAGWIESAAAGPVPLEVRAALERLAPRARIELGAAPEGARSRKGAAGRAGARPDDLAYVAFTSGTTGAPLGIAGTHRPLSHFFAWSGRRFGFTAGDRFALLSGLGHDPLLRDVFSPLVAGGALYLPALRGPADYERLPAWLERHGVTVLHLTPALGRALAAGGGARLPALRWVFFGGDALDPRLVRDFRTLAPNAGLVAFYGTTETPQAPAWHPIDPDEPAASGEAVPLGRGIDGAQLLVLRDSETLAAPGEPGEIAVRTPYLARGYLGGGPGGELGGGPAPGGFAGRFRASPWSGEAGDRLFLTGDRGRFRADGSVVFLGRIGRQVKVRGFRVEPEGIERALLSHPEVAAAAVVAVGPGAGPGGAAGETALAAFAVPRRGANRPAPEELRRHLAARLPEPMVPAVCRWLERLPLRPNGKVDLAALARLAAEPAAGRRPAPGAGERPRPGTEARLAGLWAEVLGCAEVGRAEHFFEAGGHSLAAIRLISRIRAAFGVELALDRLLESPTLAGMARRLDAAREEGPGAAALLPPVVPGQRAEPPEASLGQERLWFLDRLEPGSAAYTLCDGFLLAGPFEPALLARAFRAVAARHEVLRTAFPAAGGVPRLRIDPVPRVELPVADLGALPPAAARGEAARLARRTAARPFDLARGPLVRLLLARLDDERHLLAVAVHHAVTDGWSQDLLYRELGAAYRALAAGAGPDLPPLTVQHADFAAWQRRFLDGALLEPRLAFWRARLAEAPAVELAADRPRRAARTAGGRSHRWQVGAATAGGLRRLALAAGATPFIALLAAFELLLARHTGSDDVAIGFPLANRRRPELEGLIGFFVNTVVLRDRIAPDGGREPSFRELLGRVRDGVMAAHAHQDLPFERLVEALMPERDLARNPLFQVAFAVRYGPEPRPELPGVTATRIAIDPPAVRLDLEVHARVGAGPAEDAEDRIEGEALYDAGLFDATTVERLFRNFRSLLAAAVAAPDAPVGELAMLSPAERHQLLAEWGRPAPLDPAPPGLARRFADRVAEAPDAVAVVEGDGARQVSYAELGREASALAERLRGAGMRPGDLVALYLGRSLDLVVATLGVQAAGGAPLPVDPANPPERVAQILEQAFPPGASPVILTWEPLLPRLPAEYRGAEATVLLDPGGGEMERRRRPRAAAALPAPGPELLGFAIATSGSTGRPKIAELPQHGLSALVDWHRRECGAAPGVHTSLLAAPGFDASVWELWTALGNGATLELPPPYAALDQDAVDRWLAERRVEVGFLPTPLAEAFLARVVGAEPPALRVLVTGADVLRARPAPGTPFRLVNGYGPAEATVVATWGPVAAAGPAEPGLPGIGRPLPGVALALLDPRLRPVPPGAPGEICLGGPGLARGYRGRPAATAAAFVPDPWPLAPGERLYRTGDLGRLRPDGTLDFLGRRDQQAKIRGYRIEPGEIEAALKDHPEVAEAAVLVHSAAGGDKRLVAFVAGGIGAGEDAGPDRERVDHWRRLYDRTYAEPGAPGDDDLDLRGWNSSYTGEPLPAAEMREWREATVERVLALRPRRVLEIGCGTGLVLHGVAPRCESYLGTDLSRPALDLIERRLTGGVRLLEREARDFTGIPEGAFDLVVVNSVVQYFPGVPYLLSVLRGAVAAAAPAGAIFVGDVRSLPLLETFCAGIWAAVGARARQRALDEEELVIDPGFFLALERELPRIAAVRIEPKRGRSVNELTRFRYDVTLFLDRPRAGEDSRPLEPRWLEWGRDAGSAAAVAGALAAERPPALLVAGVPNARLAPGGLEPEDLLELGRRAGYRASLSWARPAADGAFDALFVRSDAAPAAAPGPSVADGRSAPLAPLERLASDPLAAERRRLGARRLRAYLEERLPRYMVPAEIVLLPELPLNANGKLDRRALAARLAEPAALGRGLPPPRTPEERRIAAIWSEALGVEPVGLRDDFFRLGGHSLMAAAVADRIERELGVELPVSAFFRHPTVEGLAGAIRGGPGAGGRPSLIELRAGAAGAPLVCVHPAGGQLLCYGDLVRALSAGRPVLGLEDAAGLGTAAREPGEDGLAALAGRYLRELADLFEAPPVLLGWSLGGVIAFELARQWAAAGATPPLVVLLDSSTPEALRAPAVPDPDTPPRLLELFRRHVELFRAWRPRPYPGRVLLFRALEPAAEPGSDPALGWAPLARGGLEVRVAAGDHHAMIRAPRVARLAAELEHRLAGLEAADATRGAASGAGLGVRPREAAP